MRYDYNRINVVVILLISLISYSTSLAQERKSIQAVRIQTAPKIDGILTDDVWQHIPASGNFIGHEPHNGKEERTTHPTQVKVAYNDEAIYIAAYLYDNEPNKILRQFTQRDDVFEQNDVFGVMINTLDDGINETRFYVTSAGTIGDSRNSLGEDDFSYNVVFKAEISFDEQGWYAEFEIPYSALRFPRKEQQEWGINFFREIKHLNENYSCNFINREIGNTNQYNGKLTGITAIDPPLRLQLYPFLQGTSTTLNSLTQNDFSAGMDVKYGLSDSFTLDATLIPDFGQAAFDNVELNLSPFEQQFSENRQFFTEGTELYNKGNLFYSRRVGGRPSRMDTVESQLYDNEIITNNPSKVELINALKISGRNKHNLGIGLFNAITKETKAHILNTATGEKRSIITEPLSNYNILVLDQQFNKNSSVTLINTNVTRAGDFRDANVTGVLYNIYNSSNTYNSTGEVKMSQVREDGTTSGMQTAFSLSKTKGKFRWSLAHELANKSYNPNDLGILFRNNYNNFQGELSYRIFQPVGKFNDMNVRLTVNQNRLLDPGVHTMTSFGLSTFFFTVKRFAFGGGANYNTQFKDYFEPRVPGKYVLYNANAGANAWVSSDYRNKFAYDVRASFLSYKEAPMKGYSLTLEPRYRFSDKLLLVWKSIFNLQDNYFGFVTRTDEDVILGQRDVKSIEHSLRGSYNFDPYKSINLRFRNFWSTANYSSNEYFTLNPDGSKTSTNWDTDVYDPNTNFNIWNIDLSFNWRFAPGSEAILLYRNQLFNQDKLANLDFNQSLENLFNQPALHLSLIHI